MTRRRMDSDTKWRILHHEALRTFARRHYRLILFGPYIARGLLLVGAVVGLMALWLYVDHVMLGVAAFILAAILGVVWLFVSNSMSSLQSRMAARAAGHEPKRAAGFGWAVAGVFLLLVGTGYLALWSPYA
jgi:hypothetical protein